MITIYTIIIGASKIGAIWAIRVVVRKSFQTITVLAVTALYIEIQKRKSEKYGKYRKKKRKRSNHEEHLMLRESSSNNVLESLKDLFSKYPLN